MTADTCVLFSVVMPTFDRAAFLDEAVRSVLAQTESRLELIIVDDASPVPVSARWADSRVKIIRHAENLGATRARNTGMEHAVGRYLVFLDDDDLWLPNRLRLAIEGLRRAPIAICFRGDMNARPTSIRRLEGRVHDEIAVGLTPHLGQTAVVRTLALPFDERFRAVEDVDWWIRATKVLSVTTVPEVGMLYRQHSGPRNGNGLRVRYEDSFLLLRTHDTYFRQRPRAAAFRYLRIGLLAAWCGDRVAARRALMTSFRLRPSARSLKHFIKPPRTRIAS